MPLRNSMPFVWPPKGLSDAVDGSNAFHGAMSLLQNLIPDPTTESVWQPRPPAISSTTFAGFTTPGFVSAAAVIGNRWYGMVASGRNAGKDEPFIYDLLAQTFITVSGITSTNVPTSPATSGPWTPPIIAQVGNRIVVTHPGFPGGAGGNKLGWFDVSGFNQGVIGDTANGSAFIIGNPNIFGVQTGMTVSGPNIPANTTVLFATNAYTAVSFTGTSHSTFTIDGITSTADMIAGMFVAGPGILPGTFITQIVSGTSILLNQQMTASATTTFYAYALSPSIPGGYVGTLTGGSTTILTPTTTGLWVGQSITSTTPGVGIPPGSIIEVISPGVSIIINQAATASGPIGFQVSGAVIVLSANATGTATGQQFTIAGGTAAAPLWGAGDTQPNNLPSVPLGVAQMNGRAYFVCGTDGIPFSDPGFACQRLNETAIQALTTNDGLACTAIGAQMLGTLTGGSIQSLFVFEGTNKIQQITGDQTTNNLSMAALPVSTGTASPLSICNCFLGLAFMSPEGLRMIDLVGRVSQPLGDHGKGITTPFIYAVEPSRICAASNSDTIRITVQNGAKGGNPYEEYWYDLTRTSVGNEKVWHGPHTSACSLIQGWGAKFAQTLIGVNANIFTSDAVPVASDGFVENGVQLIWLYEPVLLPDNQSMVMNSTIWMTLFCGGPECDPLAPPEPILYTPGPIGGPPVFPGSRFGNLEATTSTMFSGSGTAATSSFTVDAADIRYSAVWDFPAMAASPLGTLKASIYLDSTNGDDGGVPDLFQVYPSIGANLISAADTLQIFVSNARLCNNTPGAMFSLPIKSIDNNTTATITLYGTNPLGEFSGGIGSSIFISLAGVLNPGWPTGPGLKTVASSTGSTITVNWDTTTFGAWVEDTHFTNTSQVHIGYIASVTSATNAVITTNIPHNLDATAVAAGHVYLQIAFVSIPTPAPGSGWDTVGLATKVKVLSLPTPTTIETDLNSTGFAAWNTIGQYGVLVNILNALFIQVFGYDETFVAGTTNEYYLAKTYFTPLTWDAWQEVIIAWDTNHAAGTKTLDVSFGDTVLTPVHTDDPCPAFNVPYSSSGATSISFSVPNTWELFYLTHCYAAEVWFDAGVNLTPTVAGNRHKFFDAGTGKPISLGATGQTPTGSNPTLYLTLQPASIVPPPALTFVDPAGNELVQLAGTLGGLADSTSAVMSWWMDRNLLAGTLTGLIDGSGSQVKIDNSVTPPLIAVDLKDASGNHFTFSFPGPTGTAANVRFSVDTNHAVGAKVVHAFVGNTAQSVTVIQDDVPNLLVHWQNGLFDFYAVGDCGGYIAALWFGPGQLFDITSKFVDGSGNPVDLGANGQLPSGVQPTCYFNATPGSATSFYTNLGSGGAFIFQSGVSSAFLLQDGTRITDNPAGNSTIISLNSTATGYGTTLLAPTSPTN